MAKQTINIGSGELAGNGESIRSAFSKINDNFDELYTNGGGGTGVTGPQGPSGAVGAVGPTGPAGTGGTSISTSDTAPLTPELGDLWYDTVSGRMYVYYDSGWVDANPSAVGPIGPQGPSGSAGPTGAVGLQGVAGSNGAAGPQGPQGVAGSNGAGGPQGPQGVAGATGPQGVAGSNGAAGPQGPQGAEGLRGAAGETGSVGATGPQGNPGISGPAGPRGVAGENGAVGATGPQGDAGPRGLQGDQGVSIVLLGTVTNSLSLPLSANFGEGYIAVDTGRVWFWGTNTAWNDVGQIVGPKGDIGDTGPAGATGDPGAVGPTGPQGDPGQQGDPGPAGAAGDPGALGPTGPQGDTGPTGPQGDVGPTGPAGGEEYTPLTPTDWQGSPTVATFTAGLDELAGRTSVIEGSKDRLTTGSYSVVLGADGVLTLPGGNTRIGDVYGAGNDVIAGSTGTAVGVLTQGTGGYATLQWIGDTTTSTTNAAAVIVNSPFSASSGTVQIATGAVNGPVTDNIWEFGSTGTLTAPGHILPNADLAYDLGSTTTQWRSIYVGTGTIFIGGVALGVDQNNYVTVDGNPIITVNTAGSLTLQGDTHIGFGTVTVSDTAPPTDIEGAQWFNTVDGRTYIAYNGVWVDASPLMMPAPDTDIDVVSITFPDASVQTTAFTGVSSASTHIEYTDGQSGYTSTVDLGYNFEVDVDDAHLNLNGVGTWSIGSNNFDTKIFSTDDPGNEPRVIVVRAGDDDWTFGPLGLLTLPGGSVISDTTGALRLEPTGVTSSATQALLIYPTVQDGNHIHLTAGGGETDLYLGNDIQYVKVDHSGAIVVGTVGANTSTWTFGTDGTLTLPSGGTIADTTTTMILTPNSPGQVTSLVLRSTYSSYMTADYPTDQGYQQYLHQLDPVTWPDPHVSTGTEGTVISITLWDASGLQYVQGDVEYIITGTGITAADFTPAVLTGTFAAANWTLDGGGFNYTNTNLLMIADDAIVEGQETFTITIITTGTYGHSNGSNYLSVNIADGTSEGSESGHIHLISENMAQTSIFLGNDDKYVKVGSDDQVYINVPNVDSSGTSQTWTFGTDGSTTLPIGVSIDEYNGSHFPRIVAATGKAFSVQGQGSTGSVALQWIETESTSSQIAQVGLNKFGLSGLAAVTLTAGTSTNDMKIWTFAADGGLTFPDATVQTTAFVQGEQIFTVNTGTTAYAPTAVDFNLLFVTSAVGYSETDPTSVTLPAGVPGQRLVIFNGYNLATLTVNPGPVGRDISSGVVAEFIYSGFDGLWIPLYGTNSPT